MFKSTIREKSYTIVWLFFILSVIFSHVTIAQDGGGGSHPWEIKMKELGLVDVISKDSTIRLEMKYASTDNFVGKNMYGSFNKAFLQEHFARKVLDANAILRKENPKYTLLIYDAARPLSVQWKMYELVKGTPLSVYVAAPHKGGRHNYGVAVDLTIYDIEAGQPLDMGTEFDHFGPEAHVGNEAILVREGKISQEAEKNRKLLYRVMKKAGLKPYKREWWHFEENMPISEVRSRFPLLDEKSGFK
ncbi:MAG: M15 family metallopeptidase [Porphyromonas sp.]|nr:M15 family metallopeptidase [Porphyromonas sp.]